MTMTRIVQPRMEVKSVAPAVPMDFSYFPDVLSPFSAESRMSDTKAVRPYSSYLKPTGTPKVRLKLMVTGYPGYGVARFYEKVPGTQDRFVVKEKYKHLVTDKRIDALPMVIRRMPPKAIGHLYRFDPTRGFHILKPQYRRFAIRSWDMGNIGWGFPKIKIPKIDIKKKVTGVAKAVSSKVKGGTSAVAKKVKGGTSAIAKKVKVPKLSMPKADALKSVASAAKNKVISAKKAASSSAKYLAGKAKDAANSAKKLGSAASKKASEAKEWAARGMHKTAEAAKATAGKLKGAAVAAGAKAKEYARKAKDAAKAAVTKPIDAAKSVINKVKETVGGAIDKVKGVAAKPFEWLGKIGKVVMYGALAIGAIAFFYIIYRISQKQKQVAAQKASTPTLPKAPARPTFVPRPRPAGGV